MGHVLNYFYILFIDTSALLLTSEPEATCSYTSINEGTQSPSPKVKERNMRERVDDLQCKLIQNEIIKLVAETEKLNVEKEKMELEKKKLGLEIEILKQKMKSRWNPQ